MYTYKDTKTERFSGGTHGKCQLVFCRNPPGFWQLEGGGSRRGEGVIVRTQGASYIGHMPYRKVITLACHRDHRIKTWTRWMDHPEGISDPPGVSAVLNY